MRNNLSIEDFIKYAKEEFDCDITLESTGIPDTFESIFGVSFLAQNKRTDENNYFSSTLIYENTFTKCAVKPLSLDMGI